MNRLFIVFLFLFVFQTDTYSQTPFSVQRFYPEGTPCKPYRIVDGKYEDMHYVSGNNSDCSSGCKVIVYVSDGSDTLAAWIPIAQDDCPAVATNYLYNPLSKQTELFKHCECTEAERLINEEAKKQQRWRQEQRDRQDDRMNR